MRRFALTFTIVAWLTAATLINPLHSSASTPTTVKASHFHSPLHGTPKHGVKKVATPKPVHKHWPYSVTPADVEAWSRVNICEEGGNWHVRGSIYSGGLGIRNDVWAYYRRGLNVPANAADATIIQQIAVAKRIQTHVPDQHGCAAW